MAPVMGDYVLVGMDEPEHKRLRALVSVAFRQRSLAAWEPYAQSVVDGYLDQVVGRGSAELVRELTFPYPIQVIAKILGVPPEDTGRSSTSGPGGSSTWPPTPTRGSPPPRR